ncbi:hypothetical protein [Arthrobacter silvisoli]|uniref:hypothetical protein n=1 Tax=Arthrobacter silvisoli TaxID=2291022 RepID=UPI0014439F17|nr:hypothetical protein [Arthrobacter silvisoli]
MADLRENPVRVQPLASQGPIFVDASGRRLRKIKIAGLAAAALVAGYVVLLLFAFIGGSNVAAPYLPLPVPAAGDRLAPSKEAQPPGSGTPAAEPSAPPVVGQPAAPEHAVPAADPATSAAPEPAAVAPTADPAATRPGKSDEAPGQAKRPSSPAHP